MLSFFPPQYGHTLKVNPELILSHQNFSQDTKGHHPWFQFNKNVVTAKVWGWNFFKEKKIVMNDYLGSIQDALLAQK